MTIELLVTPREAGTPEAARVREAIAVRLRGLGYEVEEQRFRFPPTTLRALPLLGSGLAFLALLQLPLLSLPAVPPWGALAVWIPAAVGIVLLGLAVGQGRTSLGAELREDANLIAVRPGGRVSRWIVAHLDTKAQGHSMAGRLVAVWTLLATGLISLGLAIARLALAHSIPLAIVAAAAGLALAASALADRGNLRGRSPGARDNGTGLLAALTAAERATESTVGILITGAEEFGLVGARVFARAFPERVRDTEVINLDTLDDRGRLYLIAHDAPGERWAARVAVWLAPLGIRATVRRLPLGILVDGLPLARVGARVVTVSRLDWDTLRRMHTPRDTVEGLGFETARRVGELAGAGD